MSILRHANTPRATFRLKIVAAALLIVAADRMFFGVLPGSVLGVAALGWALTLALVVPAVRRRWRSVLALSAAMGFALALVDQPGMLTFVLFWSSVSLAALLVRRPFDSAVSWGIRLVLHGIVGPFIPACDLLRLARARTRGGGPNLLAILSIVALPLLGGGLFLAIFAGANPVIGDVLSRVEIPDLGWLVLHGVFWSFALAVLWPAFRPLRFVTLDFQPAVGEPGIAAIDLPVLTLLLSLLSFNAVFALQNALDIAFLWSGAPLPGTITLADYAHRGAYALIATALMAGAFVIVALRPGSRAGQSGPVRALVVLWTGQNILLVASSILRTMDYVDAYGMTVLRLSALAWMGLVGTGLFLICWRLVFGLSARWLINANALAATLVLSASTVIDYRAVAAHWNVVHADIAGGSTPIDLCYLNRMGSAALVPLIALESRVTDPQLRERIGWIRDHKLVDTIRTQRDWRRWTWRDDRRLRRALAMLGNPASVGDQRGGSRNCDGTIYVPPKPRPQDAMWRSAMRELPTGEPDATLAIEGALARQPLTEGDAQ
ncbi:DUF4153 domain-containing protein [Stakelama tenebrarum]|uniref:DUF4173 domain-containing protein n=1 Tax=Stakelama tenebrarum TaxID=2711215 RepID=A0A6G6Y5L4_9SPHN|nr:DUF4173 domain-containing protein [Sphingosinithalassobacter tenebrarum]QIG79866.1 DUF4173 domain-containing protein [Sphingosinithalassobacter tenebrarum]